MPFMYDVIYAFHTEKKQNGEHLQEKDQLIENLYFLEKGIVEVYMVLDEREFVIERLFKGSIINFDTFLMKQKAIVNMRFVTPGSVKILTRDKMRQLMAQDRNLQEACFKNHIKRNK